MRPLTWRILDLRNSLFTTSLAEQYARGRSVSEDVTTDWLAAICSLEECTGARITLDLVGHEHSDVELWTESARASLGRFRTTFSDVRELRKELVELLLTLVELTTASVVDAEECHDAVDDEQAVLITDEELGDLV